MAVNPHGYCRPGTGRGPVDERSSFGSAEPDQERVHISRTRSWQSVVKVWRRTETSEAPRRQGATTENTGSI